MNRVFCSRKYTLVYTIVDNSGENLAKMWITFRFLTRKYTLVYTIFILTLSFLAKISLKLKNYPQPLTRVEKCAILLIYNKIVL